MSQLKLFIVHNYTFPDDFYSGIFAVGHRIQNIRQLISFSDVL